MAENTLDARASIGITKATKIDFDAAKVVWQKETGLSKTDEEFVQDLIKIFNQWMKAK